VDRADEPRPRNGDANFSSRHDRGRYRPLSPDVKQKVDEFWRVARLNTSSTLYFRLLDARSLIVLGGELAEAPQQLLAGVREAAIGRSLPMATRNLRLGVSRLGARAGVIGAAAMVVEHVLAPENVDREVRATPADGRSSRADFVSLSRLLRIASRIHLGFRPFACPTSTLSPRRGGTGAPTGATSRSRR